MDSNDYRFSLDFYREDWSPVGQTSVDIDWEPALEWTHFEGVRSGRLPPVLNVCPAVVIPVWDKEWRAPYVESFEVVMPGIDGNNFVGEIPLNYLCELARTHSAKLVEQGKLRAGELFRYKVCAFAKNARSESATAAGLIVEEEEQPLDLRLSSLTEFTRNAEPAGNGTRNERDVPVFIPARVLDEVTAAANKAGDLETGGVLLGKLYRDEALPDIFIEVTAQVHALHTQAQHTKLTFTPETWESVRAAIKLRRQNEIMVGWWHTHPDFCKNCPAEKRAVCTYSQPFFSADDCALHRTIFSRAFNVGLLASYLSSGELTHTLFGWRHGIVAARGFYVRPARQITTTRSEDIHHGATKY